MAGNLARSLWILFFVVEPAMETCFGFAVPPVIAAILFLFKVVQLMTNHFCFVCSDSSDDPFYSSFVVFCSDASDGYISFFVLR